MKNKVIYLVAVLFTACTFSSCSENDNDSDSLVGNWNYANSHIEMEYLEKSIPLPGNMTLGQLIPGMENSPIAGHTSISVDIAKSALSKFANDKMKDYFQGIKFTSNTGMEILMRMNDKNSDIPVDASMKATYIVQKDIIEITIDKEDIKAIAGKDMNIPSISLNYTLDKNSLTMYLDKVSIQAMMLQMMPVLLKQMMPDAPEAQLKIMEQYISGIMNKTTKLEIGAVLNRE